MEGNNTFLDAEYEEITDDNTYNTHNEKEETINAITTMRFYKDNLDPSDILVNYAIKNNVLEEIFSYENIHPFFYNINLENPKTIYTTKETAAILGVEPHWVINHLRRSPVFNNYINPVRKGERQKKQYRFTYESIFRLFLYHYLADKKNITYDELLHVLGEIDVYIDNSNATTKESNLEESEIKQLIIAETVAMKKENMMLLGNIYDLVNNVKGELTLVRDILSRQTELHSTRKEKIFIEQKRLYEEINTNNLKLVQLKNELSRNQEVTNEFHPKLTALTAELEELREAQAKYKPAEENGPTEKVGFIARLLNKIPEQKTIVLKDYEQLITKTTSEIQNLTVMFKSLRPPEEINAEIEKIETNLSSIYNVLDLLEKEHVQLTGEINNLMETVRHISNPALLEINTNYISLEDNEDEDEHNK